MAKFNTTNSNLFSNNNKETIPDWMQNLTNNLMIKQKESIQLEVEKRGIFAENQQVYRNEVTADPRYLENIYTESKLLADSKIMLAKFLSGKYYKIINTNPGVDYINLQVKVDGVPANFNFPFEVKTSKLNYASTFYVDDSEYPFSKAGFNECLADIKNGTLKTASKPEAIGKVYLINREEIIRRFNGSLREATDKINQFLNEGSIVGAGSNSYASFMDVDQLFPQMEKQAGEEKLPEFHFAPNQEHVATNEYKSADVLSIEASKILNNHFNDFKITASNRKGNNLFVKAMILTDNGVRSDAELTLPIEDEKVSFIKEAKIQNNVIEFTQFVNNLNSIENEALNKYLSTNKVNNKIAQNSMLTKKDITNKLFKIIDASKIDSVVDDWIEKGLIMPVNSSTYATNHTFEELLNNSNLLVMSSDQVEEIENYEKHFGQGLEVDTDLVKPADEVREIEDIGDEQLRLFNANSYISKTLKQYKVASFTNKDKDVYEMNIEFVNKQFGTKHRVPFEISFEGSKVTSCVANIGNKKINLDKLAEAFTNNKVLSLYLQDKKDLNVGPIVISKVDMKKRLTSVVTSSKIDFIINNWIDNGDVSLLNSETIASEKSFSELLATISDEDVITDGEKSEIEYRKQHFGKDIKVDTDDKIEDTGVREAEEVWNSERMSLAASNEIGKLFNDYQFNSIGHSDNNYFVTATVKNPLNGAPIFLGFDFKLNGGKLGELVSISHGDDVVPVEKTRELLQKYTSEASLKFSEQNKIFDKNYNVLISKTNLENKLRTVASENKVASLIEKFVLNNTIQKINSATFASKHTVAELIAIASDELSVEDGKEETLLSVRDEHKLSLENNHIMDNDSRDLKATIRELTPQMITAKEKIVCDVYKAASMKKITAKKSELFLFALENSKTIQDLEAVSSQLKQYLK